MWHPNYIPPPRRYPVRSPAPHTSGKVLEPSSRCSSIASPYGTTAAYITIIQGNNSSPPTHSTPRARMTIPLPQLLFPDPFSRPSSLQALSHKLESHVDSTSCQPHAISFCSSYGAHSYMAQHDSPHSSGSSLTSRANSGTDTQPQDVANALTKKSSLKRKRDSKPGSDVPPLEGTLKTTREAPKKKKANRGECPPDPKYTF